MKRNWHRDDNGRCIAVTGIGVISSIGKNLEEFTQSLFDGKSGVDFMKHPDVGILPIKIGAQISDFSFDGELQKFPQEGQELAAKAKRNARRSPLSVQTSVLASIQAWVQAGLCEEKVSPERIGLVVAGSNISQNLQYGLYEKLKQSPEYVTPSYGLHFMDTDHVGTISEILGIQGEGFTVGGASASGNVAIIKGCQLIQLGIVDICVIAGSLTDLSPIEMSSFYNLGACGGRSFANEPQKACRPFDREHEGFIWGQGAGCLILESLESAEKRNAHVLAEVLGGAHVLDGNRLSTPNEDGEVRAMENALKNACVSYKDIDYVNTHGTSTPLGDITELNAIKRVFKERLPEVWVNSTKGLTGHCLYSAGVIEAIATIIQMRGGFVHPNANLDNPVDCECRLNRKQAIKAELNAAISNSFGFGGINTSIILKKGVKSNESWN